MNPRRDALPRDARRSLFVYNFLFPFVFVVLLPGFVVRMARRGGFRQHFGERFGRYDADKSARMRTMHPVWIHSISVGETLVALKLARALRERDPALHAVISVTTSTGFALALDGRESWMEIIYNPVDTPGIVRAALNAIRPSQVIFVEGEIWPNLIAECARRDIRASLVDARLSPRSEARFRRFRRWTGPVFRLLHAIHVTQEEETDRWIALGVERTRVRSVGSIKFDNPAHASPSRATEFRNLLRAHGIPDDAPVLLGGSTWAPEEIVLGGVAAQLRKKFPKLLLIVVPRHVERTADLVHQFVPRDLRVVRRSELASTKPGRDEPLPFDVLVVDTTGELRDWYQLATVVFVGKSLVTRGGQNPAEPAALGKAIVFGPHMENFAALAAHLVKEGAAVQVAGADELFREIERLLEDEPTRLARGRRAQETLAAHRGVAGKTAALLLH